MFEQNYTKLFAITGGKFGEKGKKLVKEIRDKQIVNSIKNLSEQEFYEFKSIILANLNAIELFLDDIIQKGQLTNQVTFQYDSLYQKYYFQIKTLFENEGNHEEISLICVNHLEYIKWLQKIVLNEDLFNQNKFVSLLESQNRSFTAFEILYDLKKAIESYLDLIFSSQNPRNLMPNGFKINAKDLKIIVDKFSNATKKQIKDSINATMKIAEEKWEIEKEFKIIYKKYQLLLKKIEEILHDIHKNPLKGLDIYVQIDIFIKNINKKRLSCEICEELNSCLPYEVEDLEKRVNLLNTLDSNFIERVSKVILKVLNEYRKLISEKEVEYEKTMDHKEITMGLNNTSPYKRVPAYFYNLIVCGTLKQTSFGESEEIVNILSDNSKELFNTINEIINGNNKSIGNKVAKKVDWNELLKEVSEEELNIYFYIQDHQNLYRKVEEDDLLNLFKDENLLRKKYQ